MNADNNQYFAFPIKSLLSCNSNITFSVYLKFKEDHFIAIFTPKSGIDNERLKRYISKVKYAYVHVKEKSRFESFTNNGIKLSNSTTQETSNNESDKKRIIDSVIKVTEKNLNEIFLPNNVNEKCIKETKVIVKGYINILSKDPSIIFRILSHFERDNYISFHSLATSTLGIFLCRLSKNFSSRMLEIVGLGGLLHDIGKSYLELPEALNGYSEQLSNDPIMMKHPELGLKVVQRFDVVPEEVRMIILQHHEAFNGTGYPKQLRASKIYIPATIVSAADCFINYISKTPYGLGLTVEMAIDKMRKREGVFNSDLINHLENLYGVK